MTLLKFNPTETKAWAKLTQHYLDMQYVRMQDLFEEDPKRVDKMHILWNDILLDYSKNRTTDTTLQLLMEFAKEMHLSLGIKAMYSGEIINETEDRAVGHMALRDLENCLQFPHHDEVIATLNQIKEFTEEILRGKRLGSTGKRFTDVINIGIGGSDLGPKMVVESLSDYKTDVNIHYISNIDYDYIHETLSKLSPETTLVIVASKSFSTLETLTNSNVVKKWILAHGLSTQKHMIGVTTAVEKAIDYGIAADGIFPMWDWVGGRFSLWSAVGISISLGVGYDNFVELLLGANDLDKHFVEAPVENNIPCVLALISIWYANFCGYETEAIIPYSNRLSSFPAYLQQVIMESNGKNVSRSGYQVDYQTCNIVWGEIGTNSQHAFFQLFHQGTKIIPSDFIGFVNPFHESEIHDQLMANFFAQTEGLMNGKVGKLYTSQKIDDLEKFRVFRGNRPTNTLLIDKLTPRSLGSLIAIYEHKTFVQGYLWNIYSFDQFGVEYGKKLAESIISELDKKEIQKHDTSTEFLLKHYLNFKK